MAGRSRSKRSSAKVEAVTVESARAAGRALIGARPAGDRGARARHAGLKARPRSPKVCVAGGRLTCAAAGMLAVARTQQASMAFFRTVSLRADAGDRRRRRRAARAADDRLRRMGGAARSEAANFSRPGSRPGRPTISRRGAFRRRLRRYAEDQRSDLAYAFLIFRNSGRRAGRRVDARQYPARRRAGRQPRLLDGRCHLPARAT